VAPTCHLYARVSSPEQRQGGGLLRQTGAATQDRLARLCSLHGLAPAARVMADDASAFKGGHLAPDRELGRFLAAARRGDVPAGDVLAFENWDRLSRQDPWSAVSLVSELRRMKLNLARLDNLSVLRYDEHDIGSFFEVMLEMHRGHSESAMKSHRNRAAWKRKREAARQGQPMRALLPFWVRWKDGKKGGSLELIGERAAIVRRVFALAAGGKGYARICRQLTAEGVPAPGKAGWVAPTIKRWLNDKRVLGEMQLYGPDRIPDGEPIPDYYPPCVSVKDYDAAQAAIAPRRAASGMRPGVATTKLGSLINLFGGLLVDARSGDAYVLRTGKAGRHYYSTLRSKSGRSRYLSVPRVIFDTAILQQLAEINPAEVLGGPTPSRLPELLLRRLALRRRLADLEEELRTGRTSAAGLRVLATLEDDIAKLGLEIAPLEQKSKAPLDVTWAEAQSLAVALARAPDPAEARLRLRVALRSMIDRVMLLVVPCGLDRIIAVQVFFEGGQQHRDYLLYYSAGCRFRKTRWWCRSMAEVNASPLVDLRDRASAARAETFLATLLQQLT